MKYGKIYNGCTRIKLSRISHTYPIDILLAYLLYSSPTKNTPTLTTELGGLKEMTMAMRRNREAVEEVDQTVEIAEAGEVVESSAPKAPRKPSLTWNTPQAQALAQVCREIKAGERPGDLTAKAVAKALASHPAFAGVDPELITPIKVTQTLARANKQRAEKGMEPLAELSGKKGPRVDWTALDAIE